MNQTKEYVVFRASVSGPCGRTTLVVERPFSCGIDSRLWQWAVERNLGEPLKAAELDVEGPETADVAAELAEKAEERLGRSRRAAAG